MFNKKSIAVLTVWALTAGMMINAVNADEVSNTTTSTSNVQSVEQKGKMGQFKPQMEQMKGNKEMIKWNQSQIKENRQEFKSENGTIFDKIAWLSEDEKVKLKELFDSHKVEMDALHKEMMSIDKTTLTTEQKTAFVEKNKALHLAFVEKVKSITSNEEVLKFVEAKWAMISQNKDIRVENKELRQENKDIRSDVKEQRGDMKMEKVMNKEVKKPVAQVWFNLTDAGKLKVEEYSATFKEKFSTRLDAFSVEKLETLNKTIDKYLSKTKKEGNVVYQLLALKKLVNEKLSSSVETLDVETLLN